MKKRLKQLMAVLLVFTMVVSTGTISRYASAAAKMELSSSKVTISVGEAKTVTLKNAPKGAKATWSTENSKIAKVQNGKITGVKEGSTTVVCKVTYKVNAKSVTKVFKVSVTVNRVATPTPTATPTPADKSNITASHKSANGIATKDNGQMRTDLTSKDLVKLMGQAWNLGNSLEATSVSKLTTPTGYETAWGNPVTTQKMIDGIKNYGFNAIRIPVAWSNMISDDGNYTIDNALLDRVETVINYALNNEMYVIINDHWDGGWWGQFGSPDEAIRTEAWKRYESFWTQISNRYKEYSDRLIFESANEELGDRLNDKIDGVTGVLTEKERYETVNKINQKFVDIVRASGGNNESRHLLIAGYNTDITKTCDSRFVMPTDTTKNGTGKLSISVHYYTPGTYCIAESDQGWGYSDTWGSKADINELHSYFDKMTKFTKAGYGVIIGEYGVQSPNKDGIPAFINEVVTYGTKLGYCPVLWDSGSWYSRTTYKFKYNDVAKVYIDATESNATLVDGGSNTGIPKLQTMDESKLKLVYTWEGIFTKNDGTNKLQHYEQTSCSDGLKVFNNSWGYYLYLTADWASMTEPYIKVYVKNDDVSLNSSLQFGYVDLTDGKMDNGNDVWYDRVDFQSTDGWLGKCIKLNKNDLNKYDALFLSSGNGFTVTKIEIYDLATK
ncbi:MAG TPA: cellulase family glycosylhydrolase [Mobilitalea sp.]|nr:cellulase family glycosylhydrolase [Mobilitalea sp.]